MARYVFNLTSGFGISHDVVWYSCNLRWEAELKALGSDLKSAVETCNGVTDKLTQVWLQYNVAH